MEGVLVNCSHTFYVFYVGRWVAYGVATSRDGVRWSDKGDMLYASLGGEQQRCSNGGYALGSGWVWQDPATEKWLVDFSESTSDRVRMRSVLYPRP